MYNNSHYFNEYTGRAYNGVIMAISNISLIIILVARMIIDQK